MSFPSIARYIETLTGVPHYLEDSSFVKSTEFALKLPRFYLLQSIDRISPPRDINVTISLDFLRHTPTKETDTRMGERSKFHGIRLFDTEMTVSWYSARG